MWARHCLFDDKDDDLIIDDYPHDLAAIMHVVRAAVAVDPQRYKDLLLGVVKGDPEYLFLATAEEHCEALLRFHNIKQPTRDWNEIAGRFKTGEEDAG
jgi:hypothetical protein